MYTAWYVYSTVRVQYGTCTVWCVWGVTECAIQQQLSGTCIRRTGITWPCPECETCWGPAICFNKPLRWPWPGSKLESHCRKHLLSAGSLRRQGSGWMGRWVRRGRRSSGEESGFGSGGSALSGYPPSSPPPLWLTRLIRRRSHWGVFCARGLSHFHKAPPGLDREATMGKPTGVLDAFLLSCLKEYALNTCDGHLLFVPWAPIL